MLLAAQSMAVGTVMVRWVAKYCDPVVATGGAEAQGLLFLLETVKPWSEGVTVGSGCLCPFVPVGRTHC